MPTGSRKKYFFALIIFLLPAYVAAGSIDTGKVEETWLQWNNELRASLDLPGYTLDSRLSATAQDWSEEALTRDTFDHKRKETDGYYNYAGIENWFLQHGIKFRNVNRATFSESLGYGYFSCKKEDCTDDLISSIKTTRNMFMREKATVGLHYKALIHPYFQTMGLGISIDAQAKRYYLTIHYAAEVIAANTPVKKQLTPSIPPVPLIPMMP